MIILVHQLYLLATLSCKWFLRKPVNVDKIDERIVPVIVKETFGNFWEMENYLNLAAKNNYAVIVVEPWSRDVDKLAELNKHAVTADIIRGKLRAFKDIIPLYYGWFLNEQDSKLLYEIGRKCLLECVTQFPQLKKQDDNLERGIQELHDGISENEEHLKTFKTEIENAKVEQRNLVENIDKSKDELTSLTDRILGERRALEDIEKQHNKAKLEFESFHTKCTNARELLWESQGQPQQPKSQVWTMETTETTIYMIRHRSDEALGHDENQIRISRQ